MGWGGAESDNADVVGQGEAVVVLVLVDHTSDDSLLRVLVRIDVVGAENDGGPAGRAAVGAAVTSGQNVVSSNVGSTAKVSASEEDSDLVGNAVGLDLNTVDDLAKATLVGGTSGVGEGEQDSGILVFGKFSLGFVAERASLKDEFSMNIKWNFGTFFYLQRSELRNTPRRGPSCCNQFCYQMQKFTPILKQFIPIQRSRSRTGRPFKGLLPNFLTMQYFYFTS